MTLKIYTASPYKHGGIWKANKLPEYHATWVSTWPEDEEDPTLDFNKIWDTNINDVLESDGLILFAQPGDKLEGALIETGVAIGQGLPVVVVDTGFEYRNWINCSEVMFASTISGAVDKIKNYYNPVYQAR